MSEFSITLDLPMIIAVSVPVAGICAACIKNAVSISAAKTKADFAGVVSDRLRDEFNDYRVSAAVSFATNNGLKMVEDRLTAAISAFGTALERHTDRLDRLLQHAVGGKE